MGKKLLIALLVILAAGLVWALVEGEIITRQELNNRNVQNEFLDCKDLGWELARDFVPTATKKIQCLTLEPTERSKNFFEAIPFEIKEKFEIFGDYNAMQGDKPKLLSCIQKNGGVDRCWANELKPLLLNKALFFRKKIRSDLGEMKEKSNENIPFERWGIPDNELND